MKVFSYTRFYADESIGIMMEGVSQLFATTLQGMTMPQMQSESSPV